MTEAYSEPNRNGSGDERAIITKALDEFKLCEEAESQHRKLRREDLKFFLGDSDNEWQWPESIVKLRKQVGKAQRPILTINKLPLHVRQVTNEQRQNRPSIKVRPVDDNADIETAEIFDGIIRHIQDVSDADTAYDTACEHQTVAGLGYWRILTDYISDDSFDQDIRIARIRNPFKVYLDPYIQTPEGSDAEYGFIFEDIPIARFKREYPDAKPVSWEADTEGWLTKETVRVAEYFCAKYVPRTLALIALPDGSTETVWGDELPEGIQPLKTREVHERRITWYKLTSFKILDSRPWPSKWIGIVRVVGEEWEVDHQLVIKGLVRNAKDSQRMYNYWTSAEAETVALQPKAPFVMAEGQDEGYEDEWQKANVENLPVLHYRPLSVDGHPVPAPQRQMPPVPPAGFIQAKLGAADDLKSTTGQFDASLGQKSNETSGKAILARQKEGDTGTFHYLDNLAKSIRHTGRILIDMIPRIYDTKRVARIIGEDGTPGLVQLDPEMQQPKAKSSDERIKGIYNLGVGRYDVSVSVGPSYTTKRQEASEFMVQAMQADPTISQKAGDIIYSQFDIPGADRLAKRLKKFMPPEVLEEDDQDPEQKAIVLQGQVKQLSMALENADKIMDQVQAELKKVTDENQLLKIQNANKQAEIGQKADEARLEADTEIRVAELEKLAEIIVAKIDAKATEMQARLGILNTHVGTTGKNANER